MRALEHSNKQLRHGSSFCGGRLHRISNSRLAQTHARNSTRNSRTLVVVAAAAAGNERSDAAKAPSGDAGSSNGQSGNSMPGPYDSLQQRSKSVAGTMPLEYPLQPNAPVQGDKHILFAIPPAKLDTPEDQVLHCPDMRDILGPPRPNPLPTILAGVYDGRFVSDDDRVAINVMDYASATSMGGHRAAAAFSVPASTSGSPTNSIADEGGGGDSGSGDSGSGTTHLAMESGIYGSLQSTETMQGDFSLEGTHYNTVMPLPPFAMRAGPREQIYFDPATVTAAIVTTGNICPGMNDTIEAMVKRLGDYGVPEENVMGIRYGMRGFWAKDAKPVVLTRDKIEGIHLNGGTILGTSNEHRLKRRHHHHHHHHHHAADGATAAAAGGDTSSSGSDVLSATSSSDEDDVSSSGSSSDSGRSSPQQLSSADAAAARPASPRPPSRSSGNMWETHEEQLEAILHKLEFWRINLLLVIGGQGGNQLASQLAEGCQQRGIPCCIAGVPKSIDNDMMLVDKTFGFDTVVQEVVMRPLIAAKVEAQSARKGVGLVKVFGRRAGFIAVQSSLASGVVDICLIPEEPFELHGPSGVLAYLQKLLEERGHAVICVAEGAGQDLMYPGNEAIPLDDAGNPKLRDIGQFLKKAIKEVIPDADVKYIDPSNLVQAVPCSSSDHIFCRVLGFHAVDVAFAGYTGVIVGPVNGHFCMLPSHIITQSSRRVDPRGKNWNRLRASMSQPRFINAVPAQQQKKKPSKATPVAN